MSAANIVNSGVPLAGAASAPLWIDQCDNSANLTNTPAPAPLTIPVSDQYVNGVNELEFEVLAPDAIESVTVAGQVKGKLNDAITITLKHPVYGAFTLLNNHGLLGPLTTPYPLPAETRTFRTGETIPPGYIWQSFVSASTSTQVVLPEGQSPTDYYYYYTGSNGYDWQIRDITPGSAPTTITVPAHRYPYTPDRNYDLVPGNAMISVTEAIVFRGFRYRLLSTGNAEASVVADVNMANAVYNNNPNAIATNGYQSTGSNPWLDFSGYYGDGYSPFTERLFTDYGAHDWLVLKVVRTVTFYTATESNGLGVEIYYYVTDVYTVRFIKFPDLQWSVQPLAQITWESILPPLALYQYYPSDFNDNFFLGERTENLSMVMREWAGKPAEGTWTLEITGNSTAVTGTGGYAGYTLAPQPTIVPGIIRIAGLSITIAFKTNQPYANTSLSTTTPCAGVTRCETQANLRAAGDDRALIAILCGINGSSTMGILCGYALQRVGLTGEMYSVTYFVATTCNVNHVNMTRRIRAIWYENQDWATPAFSTKGNLGEAFVFGPTKHRIYPVRGQIGLRVDIKGSLLTFMLLGGYPAMPFLDPTVPLVNTFRRFSLNA